MAIGAGRSPSEISQYWHHHHQREVVKAADMGDAAAEACAGAVALGFGMCYHAMQASMRHQPFLVNVLRHHVIEVWAFDFCFAAPSQPCFDWCAARRRSPWREPRQRPPKTCAGHLSIFR